MPVPSYAFCVTIVALCLVRFPATGGARWLIGASFAGAGAALLKDAGQYAFLLGPFTVVACAASRYVVLRFRSDNDDMLQGRRAMCTARTAGVTARQLAAAVLPGLVLVSPILALNQLHFGRWKANANHGLLYYYRAGCLDRLDLPESEAQETVRRRVATARENGWIPDSATHHDYIPTIIALERHLGHEGSVFESGRLAEVGDLLKEAGQDLMWANPIATARSVATDVYRILMMPDDAYRMLPGGGYSENRLAPEHDLHAPTTYVSSVLAKSGMGNLDHYIVFSDEPRPATDGWARVVLGHRSWKEKLAIPIVVADNVYELVMVIGFTGFLAMFRIPSYRPAALLLAAIIAYHAIGSAFMGGVQPRYVVPVHPLINTFVAAGCLALFAGARRFLALVAPIGIRLRGADTPVEKCAP